MKSLSEARSATVKYLGLIDKNKEKGVEGNDVVRCVGNEILSARHGNTTGLSQARHDPQDHRVHYSDFALGSKLTVNEVHFISDALLLP